MSNNYAEPIQTIRWRTFNRQIAKEAEKRGFDVLVDELNSRGGVTWYIIETHREADDAVMKRLLDAPPVR